MLQQCPGHQRLPPSWPAKGCVLWWQDDPKQEQSHHEQKACEPMETVCFKPATTPPVVPYLPAQPELPAPGQFGPDHVRGCEGLCLPGLHGEASSVPQLLVVLALHSRSFSSWSPKKRRRRGLEAPPLPRRRTRPWHVRARHPAIAGSAMRAAWRSCTGFGTDLTLHTKAFFC